MIFKHQTCVLLGLHPAADITTSCWWHHKCIMWCNNHDMHTGKVIYNLFDTDFIHGRLWKKYKSGMTSHLTLIGCSGFGISISYFIIKKYEISNNLFMRTVFLIVENTCRWQMPLWKSINGRWLVHWFSSGQNGGGGVACGSFIYNFEWEYGKGVMELFHPQWIYMYHLLQSQ